MLMRSELDRRRAHLASGGTIENYDRSHYPQEYKDKLEKSITMIKVTLTTTSGTTRGMQFDTKEHVLEFIELFSATLPIGTAVCIDAPLIGIHSGWVQGKRAPSLV
jgi:hypothetical protein